MASFETEVDKEYESLAFQTEEEYAANGQKHFRAALIFALIGGLLTVLVASFGLKRDLFVITVGLLLFSLLLFISGAMQKGGNYKNGFVTIMNDMQLMPKTMKQLAFVQFFSWFALFAMWIYTTSAVTEFIYGTTATESKLWSDGADWVNVCFAVYNGVAALVAFALPVLAKWTSRRVTHLICLFLGGLGLISIFLYPYSKTLIYYFFQW